jgi:hypothetical protein
MLTGESRFHISTPLRVEPRSLLTGSKGLTHWTSETVCECSEIAGCPQYTCFLLLAQKFSERVLGRNKLLTLAKRQYLKKKQILLSPLSFLATQTKTAEEVMGVFFTSASHGHVHKKNFSILFRKKSFLLKNDPCWVGKTHILSEVI